MHILATFSPYLLLYHFLEPHVPSYAVVLPRGRFMLTFLFFVRHVKFYLQVDSIMPYVAGTYVFVLVSAHADECFIPDGLVYCVILL